jgi:PAS domain S-box-containing protein
LCVFDCHFRLISRNLDSEVLFGESRFTGAIGMSTASLPGYDTATLAPITLWHDHDPSGHVVQFYADDTFLLDALSRFIGTALGGGDAAIVIATKEHRDGLAQRLKERGLDLNKAHAHGRYVTLDAAETLTRFMVNGEPDEIRFTELVGGLLAAAKTSVAGETRRVAAFGEMVALLWAAGNPRAAIRLEQLWNDLAKQHSFALRCAYPMGAFDKAEHAETFLQICGEHFGVIPSEGYTELIGEDDRLRGITILQQRSQALEHEKAERREAQESLQRRESELAEILENAIEGVQQVGPDQQILWANRALLDLLGYTAEEYVNRSLAEFHVHRQVFSEFWQKLMRKEDIYDYAAELRCKDGSVKNVLIHSNGLWEGDRFVHTRCFVRDVTEHKRMERELRQSEARLRLAKDELESVVEERTAALQRLSSQLLSVQDSERRGIARELHDSLGQYLVGLKLNVDMLRRAPGREELWSQSEELMQRCISEIRTLSYLLHPPTMDEAGLASAARWYVEGFGQRSGLNVTLDAPSDLGRLPDSVELALFRVLQEALTNVHRHSGATAADILMLVDDNQLILEVKDNGRGMQAEMVSRFRATGAGMGVGLTSIRERVRELGGRLKLESNAGGTFLRVTIPIAPDPLIDSGGSISTARSIEGSGAEKE